MNQKESRAARHDGTASEKFLRDLGRRRGAQTGDMGSRSDQLHLDRSDGTSEDAGTATVALLGTDYRLEISSAPTTFHPDASLEITRRNGDAGRRRVIGATDAHIRIYLGFVVALGKSLRCGQMVLKIRQAHDAAAIATTAQRRG